MPETKRPLKVFLCHASVDKPKVRELYRTLKRRGVQPWLDAEDLIPGQNWEVEIPKAILSSDAIIICLTPNSVDKEGYVQKEIKFALDKAMEMPEGRIFLIPARLDECDLPFSLRQYQAVNLYEKTGYTKLMQALKLRALQLERSTVELSKVGETTSEINKFVEKNEPEKPKPEKLQPQKTKLRRKPNTAILVALIGLAGTILAGLLGSPLIEKWLSSTPTATGSATPTTFAQVSQPTKETDVISTSLPTDIVGNQCRVVFVDDFSTDKGWINNSEEKTVVTRDSANEWLYWITDRQVPLHYYYPIALASKSCVFRVSFFY